MLGLIILNIKRITRALEDCLEAMLILKRKKGYIRLKDLSKLLNVAPSSIISVLKRLEKMGYVKYIRREAILLTEEGEKIAQEIYNRHLIIKRFLREVLRLPDDIAEEDACAIEHKIHNETIIRLKMLTEVILSNHELKEKIRKEINR